MKKEIRMDFSGDSILQGMPELAYVFNNKGQMLMWNHNIESILGYTSEELYLKDLSSFIAPKDRDKTIQAMEAIFRDRVEQTVEYSLITKDGVQLPYIGSGSLVEVDDKQFFVGMAISTRELKDTDAKLKQQISETKKLQEQLQAENIYLREETKSQYFHDEIIGESDVLMHAISQIEKVAPTNSTVLIYGETGTDKDVFARIIHSKSKRKDHPFIMTNCSSSSNLITESELFGHEKGAFEGALERRIGKIELAHKGTLYLYEIGELDINLQSRLLRLVKEGCFERLGSSKTRKVDIRIIASTKHNIEDLIRRGRFREDLYYAISVYPITIAPLRDRIGDIPILAEDFVQRFNKKLGKKIERISKKTMLEMQRYSWPGNVRELENVIERAVIISTGTLLKVEPFLSSKDDDEKGNLLSLDEHQKRYIIKVLNKTLWRIEGPKGAAQILDMHPETLRSRMRKYGIKRPTL